MIITEWPDKTSACHVVQNLKLSVCSTFEVCSTFLISPFNVCNIFSGNEVIRYTSPFETIGLPDFDELMFDNLSEEPHAEGQLEKKKDESSKETSLTTPEISQSKFRRPFT